MRCPAIIGRVYFFLEEIAIYGRQITLFLVDGTAEGIITAEILNWNGKAVKIPRIELQDYSREDINGAGVYFLFCHDTENTDSVYIGESEYLLERLRQHLRDYQSGTEKFYWDSVAAFTGQDLNKTMIRYLEDKLVKAARECGRYRVLTRNTHSRTFVKESEKAAMAEFMDNMKLLISVMGYNVFVPAAKVESIPPRQYFFCRNSRTGADAKGFVSPRGFTVMKESHVSHEVVQSLIKSQHPHYRLRLKLEADGVILGGVFQRDYEFSSPTAAASVVRGFNASGQHYWLTEDGRRLKDISNL